jgi:hypothetical protein
MKLGNECEEGRENTRPHNFKEQSSKLASGKELTTAHFM